jgi:hypothetical protein
MNEPSGEELEKVLEGLEAEFMEIYMQEQRWNIFESEFMKWQREVERGITINERAIENLDLDSILDF